MKEASLMKKCFRNPGIRMLLFLLLTGSAWAEGLAVPTEGGVLILDGRNLTEIRTLSLGGKETPRLAVHPSSPVMAGLAGDQLVFWNLPTFTAFLSPPIFSMASSVVRPTPAISGHV